MIVAIRKAGTFMKKRRRTKRRASGWAGRVILMTLALILVISAIFWLPSMISGSVRQALSPGVSSQTNPMTGRTSERTSTSTLQSAAVPTVRSTSSTQATSDETSAASTRAGTISTRASETTRSTQSTTAPASASTRIKGLAGKIVVIDPGHQQTPNDETEPVSPGSMILKAKCSAGTRGVVTRRYEYVVNLEISLKLKSMLEAQGCTVYLTRSSHDVNISNIERAQFAVAKKADVFLRIHSNSSADATARGVKTYVGETGPFADRLPLWGRLLSTCQSAQTGAADLGVDVSSRYTGLNWAADVPSFLLEMGFMSNAEDDQLLSDPVYQDQICRGILDFVRQMPDL
jgi:N-acetylmuramoyl-L-alanine amidase